MLSPSRMEKIACKPVLPSVVRPFRADAVRAPRGSVPFRLPEGTPPDTPVDLEIGCGAGLHPIRYSRSHPDRYLIAIEHTRQKFARFAGRFAHHPQIKNLMPVHADAVAWVTHCLRPASISRCLLLYPNPNPKAPSKRWFRMPFMHRLLEVLKPGGEILLATNDQGYVREARDYASRVWGLQVVQALSFGAADVPGGAPRTHFEKKYLERGQICHELRLRLPSAPIDGCPGGTIIEG